jgi:excisionase family DNA binding protein
MTSTVHSPDRLLTCTEAADNLRISTRTLWALTNRGDLLAVRIGRRCLYRPETLRHYAERVEGAKAST